MKYYYNGYSVVGWIPDQRGGRWKYFGSDAEYFEAYDNATEELSRIGIKRR